MEFRNKSQLLAFTDVSSLVVSVIPPVVRQGSRVVANMSRYARLLGAQTRLCNTFCGQEILFPGKR